MPRIATIGDRVELKRDDITTYGHVRFIGSIQHHRGIWYGIELDSARGRHNGTYRGNTYFVCEQKHGLFVRKSFIKRVCALKSNAHRPRCTAGASVFVVSLNCEGVVRYMGTPYGVDNIYYGIELAHSVGNSNGTTHNRWCFDCRANGGVFVLGDEFRVLRAAKTKIPSNGDGDDEHSAEWRQYFLVTGYIREIERWIPNLLRWDDVLHLIFLYQNVYLDLWSARWTSKRALIDRHETTISFESGLPATAYGAQSVCSGRFQWRIQIEKFRTNRYKISPVVGIVEDSEEFLNEHRDSAFWNQRGYQYCGGNGMLCGMNSFSRDCYNRFNSAGDVMEMILDFDEQILKFIINGEDVGIVFKGIKRTAYRLALFVSACKGSRFALL